jgi:hypothetical protein
MAAGLLTAVFSLLSGTAPAQTFKFDPALSTGTNLGGSGTWTQAGTTTNWYNGTADVAWDSTKVAELTGTGGGTAPFTVSIDPANPVTAAGVTFTTDGYTVAPGGAGGTLTLSANPVTVATGVTGTISAPILGSAGLSLSGAATTSVLVLSGANTYTGGTTVLGGKLTIGATNTINTATGLTFGNLDATGASTSNVGSLDLSNFSQTLSSLSVLSNSATANTITVGNNQSLTVNSAASTAVVNIAGANNTAATTTKLTISGAGTFSVVATSGTFGVGQTSGATTFGSSSTLDMSGLANFNANVSTFRVGDFTSNGNTGLASMILATNSTITAGTLTVGVSGRNNGTSAHTLKLGSGSNILNADTIIVGGSQTGATTNRSAGSLTFNAAAGTLTIRAKNGTGGASLSVGSAVGGTSIARTNTFDVRSHSVDMLLTSLVLGTYTQGATANTGTFDNQFFFDTGTLTASTITIPAGRAP